MIVSTPIAIIAQLQILFTSTSRIRAFTDGCARYVTSLVIFAAFVAWNGGVVLGTLALLSVSF